MSKFKVGDKVRIMVDLYTGCGLKSGTIHPIESIDSDGYLRFKAVYTSGMECYLGFWPEQVEAVTANNLQVGQTYTSHNGSEWECIFVRDGKSWMIGVYPEGARGSAYDFDIDGTASWAGCHDAAGYNIKWGQKRETVTKRASVSINRQPMDSAHHTFNITFDLIDGTPDWTTAKVTPCD